MHLRSRPTYHLDFCGPNMGLTLSLYEAVVAASRYVQDFNTVEVTTRWYGKDNNV
jgi:hypothetical protein